MGAVQDEGGDLAVCVVEDPLSLDGGGETGRLFPEPVHMRLWFSGFWCFWGR